MDLKDAYKSLNEALVHAGIRNRLKVNIEYIDSESVNNKNVKRYLSNSDAVLVPGGFGLRELKE